jgi:hypothetical protein
VETSSRASIVPCIPISSSGFYKLGRRQFIKAGLICGFTAGLHDPTRHAMAQSGPITTVVPGSEIEAFKKAQQGHLIWVGQPERCARLSVEFLKAG